MGDLMDGSTNNLGFRLDFEQIYLISFYDILCTYDIGKSKPGAHF